jgi:hypothetical protein
MPLQNRVDPWGSLFRSPARGALMGNRGGALHDAGREIVRPFKGQRWIACVLEFKGRRRAVMSPGLYTELFFLDEAVALAAGHRPCAECRRPCFRRFQDAWRGARRPPSAPDMDAVLHPARVDKRGAKVTFEAPLASLPGGCFVEIDRSAWLYRDGVLLLWSPDGYVSKIRRPSGAVVTVLTPRPIVECLRNGYEPSVHNSSRVLR